MKTNTLLIFSVACSMTLASVGMASAQTIIKVSTVASHKVGVKTGPKIRPVQRATKQARRVRRGVRAGQVTRLERRALVRQQRHIRQTRARFIKNDGRLTRGERRVLRRKQARASRNIRSARTNQRTRR